MERALQQGHLDHEWKFGLSLTLPAEILEHFKATDIYDDRRGPGILQRYLQNRPPWRPGAAGRLSAEGDSKWLAGEKPSRIDYFLLPILFYASLTSDAEQVLAVPGVTDWWQANEIETFNSAEPDLRSTFPSQTATSLREGD